MKLFQNWQNIPEDAKGAVLAIGNFDGMHLGHQALLNQVMTLSKQLGKPSGLITFEPITRAFFSSKTESDISLMMGHNKVEYAKELGLDLYFQLSFDAYLSHHSGEIFIQKILIDAIGVSHLVVGFDFLFGHKRSGDVDLLKTYKDDFGCTVVEKQMINGSKIGSSVIREAIQKGQLDLAKEILGHEWIVDARICNNELDFGHYIQPGDGEYEVTCFVGEEKTKNTVIVEAKKIRLKSKINTRQDQFLRLVF